jgi:hypothetical protein
VGVTLELAGTSDQPCRVALQSTWLRLDERRVEGDRLPPPVMLTRSSMVRAYVAYPFAVTDDVKSATLMVDGAAIEMRLAP